jgi:peroxiredoxin
MNMDYKTMRKYVWTTALVIGSILTMATTFRNDRSLLVSSTSPTGPEVSAYGYQIGDAVVNFRLKNIDGNMIALSDYAPKKGVIVVFTCNHCPFARAYEDRIVELHKKYAGAGYPVVTINPSDPIAYEDDTFDQMQERAKSKGYTYPYLVDDSQIVAKEFGATRTPHVFVLKNTGGKFVVQYIGTVDDNPQDPTNVTKRYVDDAVTNLLAGKPVITTTTKAIGCAIKWKETIYMYNNR